MKRILILTAGFGDGHNAAARSLRHGIESLSEEVKVEVLDLFESTYGSLNTLMRHAYQGVVQYAPTVWPGSFPFSTTARFSFIASSDFHNPKHIYSWKTLLHCENEPEVIKECIRRKEHVALTLYRDSLTGAALREQASRRLKSAQALKILPSSSAALQVARV